ncbi:DNA polymerase alpha, subunit B [Piromyces finnis]|uniref:DNA polymerase alpha subunit B n=1 Tax=Piromyces finnis TaxID=1754191 RepID=A0A1Y1VMD3_9FUNG|nr:DNA polymerase alpha, subunit B [Piromyces finnis]|eukprot:ORX59305.1 DNA polymerase alpha, subunit B [Piromyces finnis]
MEDQIRQAFSQEKLTDDIVRQLSKLCEIYELSPEELNDNWETYIIKQEATDISIEQIEDFKITVLQRWVEEESKNKKINTPFKKQSNTMDIDSEKVFNENSIDNLDSIITGITKSNKGKFPLLSPKRNSIKSSISNTPFSPTKYGNIEKKNEISSLTKKFQERKKRGELEAALNKDIPEPTIDFDISKEVSLELINKDQQIECYRYMFSKLNDIGEIMNKRIDDISELILKHNNIEYFTPPQIISSDEFVTAGRLCTDDIDIMDSINTKTNDRSYVLETSQSTGSGYRIKLNFSQLINEGKEYTIFPGQIVGVKGTNSTGNCLDVTEIIEPPPLPIPATNIKELSQYYGNGKEQPISVFVASGPYTCEDSLEYEPLDELFNNYILPEKPNVLILMGPFVDDRHPFIMNGETKLLPEEIFQKYISPQIQQFYKSSPHSTIILIPSLNDLLSESICFPQPPLDSEITPRNEQFSRNALGLPSDLERFHCLPNPVQFQINDVIFAISNNDIISHMYNEEFYRPARSSGLGSPFKGSVKSNHRPMDRISRLTRHLLQQHSLYPLFPSAIDEANINYEHAKGFYLNIKPDILILNSAVRLFAKNVDDVICVNPGQVVHKVTGTFSKFYIYPKDLTSYMKEVKKEEELTNFKMEEDEGLTKVKMEEDDDQHNMEVDQINIFNDVSKRCRVEIRRV